MYTYLVTYFVRIPTGVQLPPFMYRTGDMIQRRRSPVADEADIVQVKTDIMIHENNVVVILENITLNGLVLLSSRP